MSKKTFSIIIPSWNNVEQLKNNLSAVQVAAKKIDAEIIVVDDASQLDDTQVFLNNLKNIKVICNSKNLGFSKTVNIGVHASHRDIVILLNTDVIPKPDCFEHLSRDFDDPNLFAVSFNSDGRLAAGTWSQGLLQHHPVNPVSSNSHYTLWASGGQAAFDRIKWNLLGGMDTIYTPFYWEDVDLGYRAWKSGWTIRWSQNSHCVHDHKQSSIRNHFSPSTVKRIALRNQLLFVWKNITEPKMILSHLVNLPKLILHYPLSFFAALTRLPIALEHRSRQIKTYTISDQQVLSRWS